MELNSARPGVPTATDTPAVVLCDEDAVGGPESESGQAKNNRTHNSCLGRLRSARGGLPGLLSLRPADHGSFQAPSRCNAPAFFLVKSRSPVNGQPKHATIGPTWSRVESARAAPDFSAQIVTKTLPMPRATGICAPATCSCCRPAYHCCPAAAAAATAAARLAQRSVLAVASRPERWCQPRRAAPQNKG
jgi:hypothetical protein